MEETIHSIDVAGDFEDSIAQGSTPLERKTSVAVKLVSVHCEACTGGIDR